MSDGDERGIEMTVDEAIKILHAMQKWLRGDGEIPYTSKEYGVAIDEGIRALRREKRRKKKDVV